MSAGSWQGMILRSKGLRAIQALLNFTELPRGADLTHFFQEI